mgnify:FL=1
MTQFPELDAVLGALTAGVQAALGENCLAVYLQGSFGVGDADEHSDVDFMVVVRQDLGEAELKALQVLHGGIYEMETEWARHLEGSYFPAALLRREDPALTKLWYLDNTARVLERSDHDNSLVVRWVTRQHGLTLAGLPPQALIDPVDPDDLRREVRGVMHTWGAEILEGRYGIGNRWAQPFAVLSYCRMLQTLETGTIESKPAGMRWGLAHLEARWHGLIERAWADRPDPSTKVRLPADPAEVEATQRFIRSAIEGMG